MQTQLSLFSHPGEEMNTESTHHLTHTGATGMSCYEFEIATDPHARTWERYMQDEPDYAEFDLFLPPSTAHVEEKVETYRLGRHTRTRVNRVITTRPAGR